MNETELAWAAGFFDGEGNVHVGIAKRRWMRIVVTVAQAEPTTLERFRQAVGGIGEVRGPYATNHGGRGAYYWSAEGPDRVGSILDKLWPYLSEPKRTQIEKCIDQWDKYQQSLSLRRNTNAG